jgi:hypothetical protein
VKWFKHDSTANRDAKLEKVLLKYGADGYALYWLCIELIADRIDATHADFELEHDAELLGARLKIDTLRVEEIMRYFVSLELFENDGNRITCMKLAARLENAIVKNPALKKIQAKLTRISGETTEESGNFRELPGTSGIIPDNLGQIRLDEIRLDTEENKSREEPPIESAHTRFKKPTLQEVLDYCKERRNTVNAQRFIDYYESKGWKVGRDGMKDWKASVRTWETSEKAKPSPPSYSVTLPDWQKKLSGAAE